MCQIYHLFAKKSESGPKCQIMFLKLKFEKKKKSNLQKKNKEKNRKQNKKTNRVKNYCDCSQNVRKLLIKP